MLTKIELEIMNILWKHAAPITSSEIIKASEGTRSWKTSSIFVILKTMLQKGYIKVAEFKPTQTRSAKAYVPTISKEEYAVTNSEKLEVDNTAFLMAFVKQKNIDKQKAEILIKEIYNKIENRNDQ